MTFWKIGKNITPIAKREYFAKYLIHREHYNGKTCLYSIPQRL